MSIRYNVFSPCHRRVPQTKQHNQFMTPIHPLHPIHNASLRFHPLHSIRHHTFSTTSTSPKKSDQLPPRPTLPESDLKHVYLKGSGPGGQKINKTSSAVQLTHLPTGLVVKSQATRSRSQNHNIAKRILAEKIEFIEKGGESRVAKKIERVQRKKASSSKKKRRKYRKLEAGKIGQILEEGDADGSEDLDGDVGLESEGVPGRRDDGSEQTGVHSTSSNLTAR